MAQKRGWKDWVKGIALYGMAPDGDLILIRTDEQGNLTVNLIPHHTTHEAGGSDEIDVTDLKGVLADLQWAKWSVYDTRANFPSPGTPGRLAYATDEKKLYRDDGSAWVLVLSLDYTDLINRAHAVDHQPGGSDPIPTGTPSDITEGATASEGTSAKFARADHVHGTPSSWTPKAHASTHQPGGSDALPTGTPSAITEGVTASEGSSTSFARADHVHGTPSEWTPKEHGNEKHNPDLLAVDGSNTMQADLSGPGAGYLKSLRWWDLFYRPAVTPSFYIPYLWNDLAYNLKRGGSASATPSPDSGSLDNLFDMELSYCRWNNPTGSIVIEVTSWRSLGWGDLIHIMQQTDWYAKDVKVEVYNPNTSAWEEVVSISNNDRHQISYTFFTNFTFTKFRITFSNFNNSNYFQLHQIAVFHATGAVTKGAFLGLDGGDMYGDVDMNGNDILSPGLVDGVDVSSHASRHHSGGADPIYWNQLAINGDPNLNGHKILNPEGASGGMVAGVKWVDAVVFDGNPPSSWTQLDLSGYVGSRRALCVFRIDRPNATNNRLYQIAPADAYDLATDSGYALGPNSCWVKAGGYGYIISLTDSTGKVMIRSESAESTDEVRLLCYFTAT